MWTFAVGDPARILPPEQHDNIWAIQRELDFPGTVYGASRDTSAAELMANQANWYGHHRDEQQVGPASAV